ncbi:MAG: CBS domain-containing protein [Sulfolobales archaeon]|nr:CBS domain-containing protein [Sulfolobales archaeon]MDW8083311.1 CBS domain-containing protein [Sulfolobales archaeon]
MRIKVEHYMSYPVVVANPQDNLARVRNLMLRYKVGHIVISVDEKPQGILSKSDFVKLMYNRKWLHKPLTEIKAQDIMSKPVYAILPTKSVTYAARRMLEKKVGSLVIVKDVATMKIAGIITRTDLVRAFAENFSELYTVADYVEKEVPTCSPEHSVFYAAEKAAMGQPVVVIDRGRVAGVVTAKDLAFLSITSLGVKKPLRIRGISPRGFETTIKVYPAIMVSEIMNTDIVSASLEEDLAAVAQIIVRNNVDVVPVVGSSEELIGVVTKQTLLKALKDSTTKKIREKRS